MTSKLYPENLPSCLCELPALLKGKVAEAAEIFLSAKCDDQGTLACEMAARLLDEEMTSQDTPYSFDERMAILGNAHKLDDWTIANSESWASDPAVREKVGFVINLAVSHAQRDKNNYWRYMNESAYCARSLARIYRERLEAEESAAFKKNLRGGGRVMNDSIFNPVHYTIYPVQPIELTEHLSFCLGNAVKYVLRAPWKGGPEDCDKAIQYLEWVQAGHDAPLSIKKYGLFHKKYAQLCAWLSNVPGDILWEDISIYTLDFLEHLDAYLAYENKVCINQMREAVKKLKSVLILRDTPGEIYEGLTGRPGQTEGCDAI